MRVTQPTVRRTAKPSAQRPATSKTAGARANTVRTGAAAYAADSLTLSGAFNTVVNVARPTPILVPVGSSSSNGGLFGSIGHFFSSAFSWLKGLFASPAPQPIRQLPPTTPTPITTKPSGTNAQADAMSIAQNFAQNYHYVYAMKTWQQAISDIPSTETTHGGNCTDLAAEAVKEFEADGINAVGRMGDLNGGAHMWVNYQDPTTGQWHFFDPTEAVVNGANAALDPSGTPNTYSNETSDVFQL
ncbi:MAG TPA: hypothetical protein V6D47_05355 [Oscillatoriaceae cyanobacterium]